MSLLIKIRLTIYQMNQTCYLLQQVREITDYLAVTKDMRWQALAIEALQEVGHIFVKQS